MPNNASDGMFEDWIADCIAQDPMFAQAKSAVSTIKIPFLAVQNRRPMFIHGSPGKRPAPSLVYALQKNLITSSPTFQNFKQQLTQFIKRLEQETQT